MSNKNFTQAVVVIHGIGEQRPMETLRRFTSAVLRDVDCQEKYFSKPDRLSESFELRKLQNVGRRPRTHFYEYYWAYKVEQSTISHIVNWLSTMLWRSPRTVPKSLKAVFYFSWILIIVTITFTLLGLGKSFTEFTLQFPTMYVSAISALLFSLLQYLILNFIGDAARYLSPLPQNIKFRHEVRADGIRLLRALHDSGEYKRIIVVGHSLGSVIAYDVLKHLWQDYHREYKKPAPSKQEALAQTEISGLSLDKNNGQSSYIEAQHALWGELRRLGNPWLVTDFITLGSPLAHASILLAFDEKDFKDRQRQRELPTNPPVYEIEETDDGPQSHFSFEEWEAFEGGFRLKSIHHAGLFGCTRWTNLYFPTRFGVFGDLVGGSLQEIFGKGIKDIAVTSNQFLTDNTLKSHTSYWDMNAKRQNNEKLPLALDALIEALDLQADRTFIEIV